MRIDKCNTMELCTSQSDS